MTDLRLRCRGYGPRSILALVVLLLFALPMTALGQGNGSLVLARVEVTKALQESGLPVYTQLPDENGRFFAMVLTGRDRLEASGLSCQILDQDIPAGTRYLIATERRDGAMAQARDFLNLVYQDRRRIMLREEPGLTQTLIGIGFASRRMSDKPLAIRLPLPDGAALRLDTLSLDVNPTIQDMMAQVAAGHIWDTISGLSGEREVVVDGAPYLITTRNTESGVPLEKATQYVLERLRAMGISARFDPWTAPDYAGRNIVGEMIGKSKPDEIIILIAHLDSINESSEEPSIPAPGADDDGSGCAGLLAVADIFRNYQFKRTIRFVFTTGEEYNLDGGTHYAQSVVGQNVRAVLNLDMIAYSSQGRPIMRLTTRRGYDPGYAADMIIANTFIEVVNNYGLAAALIPVINATGEENADQYPFWERDMAAVMVIEDEANNFNPNYHSALDLINILNPAYATAQVKAVVGTAAHLAGLYSGAGEPSPEYPDNEPVDW